MDKTDYLNKLKSTNLRPGKVQIKEFNPVVLNESENINKPKILKELFVQVGEIESLPAGAERDAQILRLGMIAELDASNLYEKLAALADDKRVATVMLDISQEEKVHAGEFESLLEEIDTEYEKAEEEGEKEVEDLVGI